MRVLAILAVFFFAAPAQAQNYDGRFQIVDTDAGVYLLDTQTGFTWVSMIITAQNGRKLTYWEPRTWYRTWDEYNKDIGKFLENNLEATKPDE